MQRKNAYRKAHQQGVFLNPFTYSFIQTHYTLDYDDDGDDENENDEKLSEKFSIVNNKKIKKKKK